MKPVFIHLDILWEKNKDVEFPDWHVTPYMFDNRDKYRYCLTMWEEVPEFKEDLETIEYWFEFYKKATIEDMLENKDSWIMFYIDYEGCDDFAIHDGYHRLTAARMARKNIIVATFDVGPYKQGK